MRLKSTELDMIHQSVVDLFSGHVDVWLFGSKVDDSALGGDIDIMIDSPHNVESPALQSARLSAGISRKMAGRKVDVVIAAPNLLELPIHRCARSQGQLI